MLQPTIASFQKAPRDGAGALYGADVSSNPEIGPIIRRGSNCWRIEKARRASVLVDAGGYFERLQEALSKARHCIMIIGWDFDWRIRLRPDAPADQNTQLGPLLGSLAEARPDLEIYILIWSVAVIHASSAPRSLLLNAPWADHPNIRFKLDTRHPVHGTHHQKLVVIDDSLAFTGGIDLTVKRWDRPTHSACDPNRVDPDGEPYAPVHDLQMMIEGPAAGALGDLARWRWQRATDEVVARPPMVPDAWPTDLEAQFVEVEIGISRTAPAWTDSQAIHESSALLREAVSRARRSLYIETQYFANFAIGDLMAQRLQQPDGPEIVILVIRDARGMLERFAMGSNRDRLIRRLMRADRFDRLRVYYAVVPDPGTIGGDGEKEVLVHDKLVIVDDLLLRMGSSNLNNRSQGLDTECDVAIEAKDRATSAAIAGLRARLLAEHLDTEAKAVEAAMKQHGSLIRAIESLNNGARGLRRYAIDPAKGPTRPLFGTRFLDPEKPFEFIWWMRRKLAVLMT